MSFSAKTYFTLIALCCASACGYQGPPTETPGPNDSAGEPSAPVAPSPPTPPAAPAPPPRPPMPLVADAPQPTTDQNAAYAQPSAQAVLFDASGGPKASQFSQGGMGDCGMISGLNAVTSVDPNLIKGHIHETGVEASGTAVYTITLFVNGGWKDIAVDGSLPTNAPHMNDGSNAQWAALYEKAIAQVAGGYTQVIGMNTTAVITQLTGVDTQQVNDRGQAALSQLSTGGAATSTGVSSGQGWYDSQTGDFVYTSTPETPPSSTAVYIYDRHYYAAIGNDHDGSGRVQTVHMDNPWNQGPGSNGTFDLTAEAFSKIFWGYGVSKSPI